MLSVKSSLRTIISSKVLFNSVGFIFGFLPLTIGISRIFRSARARIVFWTLASWGFYAFAGPGFVLLLLASTVLDFLIARRLGASEHPGERRLLLAVSVAFGLALLAVFKYSGFFIASVNATAAWLHESIALPRLALVSFLDVALPAGISFYTFMTISYTVDVYRRRIEPENDFWYFACFIALFPHLIAGPVLRARDILPQLHRLGSRHEWRLQAGLFLFAVGLAKKVLIADTIGLRVDDVFRDVASASASTLWLAAVGYALQIYFDFSGYTDMARGLGWLLGLDFTINFDSPYRALDPRDFWRRWHISLSTWFRDYVYVPLGGNRFGDGIAYRNLMVTMVLAGLWHGAGWNFIAWGTAHGGALVAYHRWHESWDRLPAPLRWFSMSTFTVLAFVIFRLRPLAEIAACYRIMFSFNFGGVQVIDPRDDLRFVLALAVALVLAVVVTRTSNDVNWEKLRPGLATALGLATAMALLKLDMTRQFLYFQF